MAVRCGVHSATSRAQFVFTTLGTTTSSGIRVGDGCGEQCLRRLAEPGLVREQEGAVAGLDLFDEAGLVAHELELARSLQRAGLGQLHAGRASTRAVLERAEQGLDELPVGELVDPRRLSLHGAEVGGEERVRHLQLAHRLRHDLALGREILGGRLGGDDELVGAELHAGREQQVAAQRLRGGGHRRVIPQQGDQAGVAGGGLREDAGEAVEALLLVGAFGLAEASRRS